LVIPGVPFYLLLIKQRFYLISFCRYLDSRAATRARRASLSALSS
jgi:hypothetical protein